MREVDHHKRWCVNVWIGILGDQILLGDLFKFFS